MNASKHILAKVLGLLLALAAASAVWAADTAAKPDAQEVAALRAVDEAWAEAYNKGDVAKVAELYAGDALLLPPGAPAARGKRAIEKFFTTDIAASQKGGYQFHITGTSTCAILGDVGWVSGTYSVTDKSGKTVDVGKYLSVSRKEGGKWRYVRDMWNSDGAVPGT